MREHEEMRIQLHGTSCPVLPGVTVGVQRGSEVVGEHPAAGADLHWELEGRLVGADLRGPYVHGRPGARYLYLSWAQAGTGMFRRAKLMLDAVPAELLAAAEAGAGLHGRLDLVLPDGSPVCAAVRPPRITWSTG